MIKVIDAIKGEEKDYEKKLEVLKIIKKIKEDIDYYERNLKKLKEELGSLLNCDFNQLEIKYRYTSFYPVKKWICGKLEGEER